MYIDKIPNRNSKPCYLLRESYREGDKVKKRTLANLSHLPISIIEGIETLLKGGVAILDFEDVFKIVESYPYGNIIAVLSTLRKIGLEKTISSKKCRERDLVVAMIVSRIIDPSSKLATAQGLSESHLTSLAQELNLQDVTEDSLYKALDWLLENQARIEAKLAKKHLTNGQLVLYDLSSTYFEGTKCPLAEYGYSRDKKKGKKQIVFGLLCNEKGCPIAVEVFKGNISDPTTLKSQIEKIKGSFALNKVIFVGDRGMITSARIDQEFKAIEGLDWITALRRDQIDSLIRKGAIKFSDLDEINIAEITHPDYPNERLIVCRNPSLGYDRARRREELLELTEKNLDKIIEATKRPNKPLKGKDNIALRVGKIIARYKSERLFNITITDNTLSYSRNVENIEQDKKLDGLYIIRTSVSKDNMNTAETISAYKSLSKVERAFRSLKTIDLKIRPIFHRIADRVKAHIFLCMLAYYVEWHMRQKLAPILFDDHDKEFAEKLRNNPIEPAKKSPKAVSKAKKKLSDDNFKVHSFQSLLKNLSTIVKSKVIIKLKENPSFYKISQLTPLQKKAFSLLGIKCRQ